MTGHRVIEATYVGGVLYTPDGPDVPDEVLPRIGDHLFPDGVRPVVEQAGSESTPSGDGGDGGTGDGDRPTGRHGFDRWLQYAGEQGVDVPEDVIDAKDKAALAALVEQHEKAAAAAAQGDPGAGDGSGA